MFRDAESQFKSAIKQQPMIPTFLYLGKIISSVKIMLLLLFCSRTTAGYKYLSFHNKVFISIAKISLRMDQPLAALEVFRTGLDFFPGIADKFEAKTKL
jgi:hypothetical protein